MGLQYALRIMMTPSFVILSLSTYSIGDLALLFRVIASSQ